VETIDWALVVVTVVINIALSIIANLLTPHVQSYWAGRSKRSALEYVKKQEQFLTDLDKYHNSHDAYNARLLSEIANILVDSLRFGLLTGPLIVIGLLIGLLTICWFVLSTMTNVVDHIPNLIDVGILSVVFITLISLGIAVPLFMLKFGLSLFANIRSTSLLLRAMYDYEATKKRITTVITGLKQKYPDLE
jgi:hypothetical protein